MDGLNIGDEYLRGSGPAALALQFVFLEDWHWATDRIPELNWELPAAPATGTPVLVLPSGPADRFETASLMMQQVIHAARARIWISSPYFVPDEGVLAMLKLAALNGVDVRILIPERPDHVLTYHAAYAFVGPLLEAGVQIHRYQEGFLHAKSFLVDDIGAGVGTVNLDNRSFRLNFEVTAIALDRAFAAEVERMFLDDFSRARRMSVAELEQQPLWRRIAARAAYLLAPVL